MDLQKIMDRNKWCMYPLRLRQITSNGGSKPGRLVECSLSSSNRSTPATSHMTGREDIFRDHRCYKCQSGKKPCVQGSPHQCEYPHARND